jgi:hypothetical protein
MTFDSYYQASLNTDEILTLDQLFNSLVLWNRRLATSAMHFARNVHATYRGDDGLRPVTERAAWFGYLAVHWPLMEGSAA